MIDLRPRRRGADPTEPRSVDELVQARIDRRLSRRELIERAWGLGVSASVLGIILHATSDFAHGRPRPQAAGTPAARADRPQSPSAPTRPAGARLAGGTVTIGSLIEPDTLHPWLTQTLPSFDVLDGVMDGLFRYNSEQQLQPALAEGLAISDDGLSYTFVLRPGVTFHNGDPFTARDFIAAWETKLDRRFGAYSVQGWEKIADVTTPDPTTLVVTTSEPYAPFLSSVGTTYLCPFAAIQEGVDAFRQSFGRRPIGTGPFRVADWAARDRIVLARYEEFWGEPAALEEIVYRILPSADAMLAELRAGEIGMVGGASGVPANRVDEALTLPGVTLFEHATQNWQHLDLKQIDFLRETPVRLALDLATPKQQIVDQILGGRALPAAADQAPGSWAYNPTVQPRPYDPAQAAALLDGVGLSPGADGVRARDGRPFAMELWSIAGDPIAAPIVELIAAAWNAIGVATTPRFGSAAAIWGPMGYQFSDKMTACLYTWTNPNDPDDLFYWHSSQIPTSPTASGGNLPAFFYPYSFQEEIDRLTAEAAATLDQEGRRQLYWQIQELLAREVPVIFLYWEQAFPAAAQDIGGFWPSAFNQLLWNAADWYLTGPAAATPVASPVAPAAATPVH